MHGQVMVTNWVTTYGEVIVRVPQRALTWKNTNAVGGNVTYVVGTNLPRHVHGVCDDARSCCLGLLKLKLVAQVSFRTGTLLRMLCMLRVFGAG